MSTPTRTLDENSGAHAESVFGDLHKGTPDSPIQYPVHLDLLNRLRSTLKVNVLPLGPAGAGGRQPERICRTFDRMYALGDTMLGCEIVVLSNRNDLTTLGAAGFLLRQGP